VTAVSFPLVDEKLQLQRRVREVHQRRLPEMSVVSRGTLSGRDHRAAVKDQDAWLVNAAFFQWDETRSVFVSPDTGMLSL